MAQQLRPLAALSEDQSSVPRTQFQGTRSPLLASVSTHVHVYILTRKHTYIHTHKVSFKLFKRD